MTQHVSSDDLSLNANGMDLSLNGMALRLNGMDLRLAATRQQMGSLAAAAIAKHLRERLAEQDSLRIVFAAAPSQTEMLLALAQEPGIDWFRITAFHMDEYLGLAADAPQRFGLWLLKTFFQRVPLAAVHLIDPERPEEYAGKISVAPIDVVLCGIGANGHLAFNDPPADLQDTAVAKVVALDLTCREQQVYDQCFARLEDVPTHAVTLTIPVLLSADKIFCCVPGTSKAEAVHSMVHDPVSGLSPATALRTHPRCTVYLDADSSSLLRG